MTRNTWMATAAIAVAIAAVLALRPDTPSPQPVQTAGTSAEVEVPARPVDPAHAGQAGKPGDIDSTPAPLQGTDERLAKVYALFASNANNPESDDWAEVPDLRYYLNPHVVASMRDLSPDQLLRKINEERSPEAAYLLALRYYADEESHVLLMLTAAGYARKPGPILDAVNGCCSYPPGDEPARRAALVKREALKQLARELHLPEAADWPQIPLDPEIANAVRAQRAIYVTDLNRSSMAANGERWVK